MAGMEPPAMGPPPAREDESEDEDFVAASPASDDLSDTSSNSSSSETSQDEEADDGDTALIGYNGANWPATDPAALLLGFDDLASLPLVEDEVEIPSTSEDEDEGEDSEAGQTPEGGAGLPQHTVAQGGSAAVALSPHPGQLSLGPTDLGHPTAVHDTYTPLPGPPQPPPGAGQAPIEQCAWINEQEVGGMLLGHDCPGGTVYNTRARCDLRDIPIEELERALLEDWEDEPARTQAAEDDLYYEAFMRAFAGDEPLPEFEDDDEDFCLSLLGGEEEEEGGGDQGQGDGAALVRRNPMRTARAQRVLQQIQATQAQGTTNVFTPEQLRTLYWQIHVHTQLLLQLHALTSRDPVIQTQLLSFQSLSMLTQLEAARLAHTTEAAYQGRPVLKQEQLSVRHDGTGWAPIVPPDARSVLDVTPLRLAPGYVKLITTLPFQTRSAHLEMEMVDKAGDCLQRRKNRRRLKQHPLMRMWTTVSAPMLKLCFSTCLDPVLHYKTLPNMPKSYWSPGEDDLLATGISRYGSDWVRIQATLLPNKNLKQIQHRQKNVVKRRKSSSVTASVSLVNGPLTAIEAQRITDGLQSLAHLLPHEMRLKYIQLPMMKPNEPPHLNGAAPQAGWPIGVLQGPSDASRGAEGSGPIGVVQVSGQAGVAIARRGRTQQAEADSDDDDEEEEDDDEEEDGCYYHLPPEVADLWDGLVKEYLPHRKPYVAYMAWQEYLASITTDSTAGGRQAATAGAAGQQQLPAAAAVSANSGSTVTASDVHTQEGAGEAGSTRLILPTTSLPASTAAPATQSAPISQLPAAPHDVSAMITRHVGHTDERARSYFPAFNMRKTGPDSAAVPQPSAADVLIDKLRREQSAAGMGGGHTLKGKSRPVRAKSKQVVEPPLDPGDPYAHIKQRLAAACDALRGVKVEDVVVAMRRIETDPQAQHVVAILMEENKRQRAAAAELAAAVQAHQAVAGRQGLFDVGMDAAPVEHVELERAADVAARLIVSGALGAGGEGAALGCARVPGAAGRIDSRAAARDVVDLSLEEEQCQEAAVCLHGGAVQGSTTASKVGTGPVVSHAGTGIPLTQVRSSSQGPDTLTRPVSVQQAVTTTAAVVLPPIPHPTSTSAQAPAAVTAKAKAVAVDKAASKDSLKSSLRSKIGAKLPKPTPKAPSRHRKRSKHRSPGGDDTDAPAGSPGCGGSREGSPGSGRVGMQLRHLPAGINPCLLEDYTYDVLPDSDSEEEEDSEDVSGDVEEADPTFLDPVDVAGGSAAASLQEPLAADAVLTGSARARFRRGPGRVQAHDQPTTSLQQPIRSVHWGLQQQADPAHHNQRYSRQPLAHHHNHYQEPVNQQRPARSARLPSTPHGATFTGDDPNNSMWALLEAAELLAAEQPDLQEQHDDLPSSPGESPARHSAPSPAPAPAAHHQTDAADAAAPPAQHQTAQAVVVNHFLGVASRHPAMGGGTSDGGLAQPPAQQPGQGQGQQGQGHQGQGQQGQGLGIGDEPQVVCQQGRQADAARAAGVSHPGDCTYDKLPDSESEYEDEHPVRQETGQSQHTQQVHGTAMVARVEPGHPALPSALPAAAYVGSSRQADGSTQGQGGVQLGQDRTGVPAFQPDDRLELRDGGSEQLDVSGAAASQGMGSAGQQLSSWPLVAFNQAAAGRQGEAVPAAAQPGDTRVQVTQPAQQHQPGQQRKRKAADTQQTHHPATDPIESVASLRPSKQRRHAQGDQDVPAAQQDEPMHDVQGMLTAGRVDVQLSLQPSTVPVASLQLPHEMGTHQQGAQQQAPDPPACPVVYQPEVKQECMSVDEQQGQEHVQRRPACFADARVDLMLDHSPDHMQPVLPEGWVWDTEDQEARPGPGPGHATQQQQRTDASPSGVGQGEQSTLYAGLGSPIAAAHPLSLGVQGLKGPVPRQVVQLAACATPGWYVSGRTGMSPRTDFLPPPTDPPATSPPAATPSPSPSTERLSPPGYSPTASLPAADPAWLERACQSMPPPAGQAHAGAAEGHAVFQQPAGASQQPAAMHSSGNTAVNVQAQLAQLRRQQQALAAQASALIMQQASGVALSEADMASKMQQIVRDTTQVAARIAALEKQAAAAPPAAAAAANHTQPGTAPMQSEVSDPQPGPQPGGASTAGVCAGGSTFSTPQEYACDELADSESEQEPTVQVDTLDSSSDEEEGADTGMPTAVQRASCDAGMRQ